ncbi:MAG TPA: DUF3108 domain-containing protein [Pyrinomonadaceae bacterium]|nr:DUF3108 domain-containing protein [Pyrinomonadaceae bacterium]HMP65609.1 DUF3108 domain-containing protein [Pyrinomonadaceae bacterium]
MTILTRLKRHYIFVAHLPQLAGVMLFLALFAGVVCAQAPEMAGNFPVGERLTYTISMEKFQNAAYAEIFAASAGKLGDRNVVEIRSRFRTVSFASAAFFLVDESRITYAAIDSGLPLLIRRTDLSAGLPSEKVYDPAGAERNAHDLATVAYAIRRTAGSGSLMLEEDGKLHQLTFQHTGSGKVSTDAGEFETTTVTLQSSYFSELGLTNVSIDLSTGATRVPVRFRFSTGRGEFTANITSIQSIVPQPDTVPTPLPTPVQTPRPTPTPTPTPRPYQPNQPIPADLAFVLGERIRMRISRDGNEVGTLTLRAAERTEFQGKDTLLLSATVSGIAANEPNLRENDTMLVRVDPEMLSPHFYELRVSGALSQLSQTGSFDQAAGQVSIAGRERVAVPFGTHTVLSLLYAMRSFNLRPSIVTDSPVNDTRVAVFWFDRPSVFSLRPSNADVILLNGERVPGQLISINTQNPQLDALAPKVWLGNDDRRLPLRIAVGSYQFDLIDSVIEIPR